MKPILILYATREGHTKKVCEHIRESLRARAHAVELRDVRELPREFALDRYAAVILGASVHLGRHEGAMVKFVTRARAQLEPLPTALLTVCLTEATIEDERKPAEVRRQASEDLAGIMERFYETTGWHPDRAAPVAGALMYREYGLVVRWMMRRIARSTSGDTDTSRNHVYTNWDALDHFVEDFIQRFVQTLEPASAASVNTAP